jgi:preprotein translocase subunit SecE
MSEISKTAYRYAALFYGIIASYFWYLFYSLWTFLGKNYFPQNISSILSIQNSNFQTLNVVFSTVFTMTMIILLLCHKRLREFLIDAGDELSRVSWPSLKEAQKTTALVIGLVILASMILFFADTLFLKIMNFIMSSAA